MSSSDLSKRQLRKLYIIKRREITVTELEIASNQIKNLFFIYFPQSTITALHTFIPRLHKKEINTTPISKILSLHNIPVINPTVTDPENHALVVNNLPIKFRPSHVIVPLMIFDRQGNSVGDGTGYYDKFLSKLPPHILKIGVSFFPPYQITLPTNPTNPTHDIKLDYCITPNKVYKFI